MENFQIIKRRVKKNSPTRYKGNDIIDPFNIRRITVTSKGLYKIKWDPFCFPNTRKERTTIIVTSRV